MNIEDEDTPGTTSGNAVELVLGLVSLVVTEGDLNARGDSAKSPLLRKFLQFLLLLSRPCPGSCLRIRAYDGH